jgi:aspartyl-tRNA(Asn)/glutamyl-tRNA(Gln) amidotransferase subunit C
MSTSAPQNQKASLTDADVLHVARLARLHLRPDEVPRMAAELSAIVGYVQKLSELDTTNVPPTAQVVDRLPLRQDVPVPSLNHDSALAGGPRVERDGFAVPGFVEEMT